MNATVAPPNEPSALLAGYQPAGDAFDELFTDAGQVRARYGPLMRDLDRLGPAELKRRADTVRRLIHEQGITYNIYGDARGLDRPWQIDLVPFVIAADEWKVLEAALVQRATLINRILADCYGAQELIRSGGLPPRSCSRSRISSGPATAFERRRTYFCTFTPRTSPARLTKVSPTAVSSTAICSPSKTFST